MVRSADRELWSPTTASASSTRTATNQLPRCGPLYWTAIDTGVTPAPARKPRTSESAARLAKPLRTTKWTGIPRTVGVARPEPTARSSRRALLPDRPPAPPDTLAPAPLAGVAGRASATRAVAKDRPRRGSRQLATARARRTDARIIRDAEFEGVTRRCVLLRPERASAEQQGSGECSGGKPWD